MAKLTPKIFHGVCYYPELWPEAEMTRDIGEMKRLGINLVRIGEFGWSTMEPDEGAIDLSFWQRVMDRLHEAGMVVVFCTPTATPPIWLTHSHPERCFRNAAGQVMLHGSRQHAAYDHPEVRAACLRIVAALAKTLGDHPALVAWQLDNEFKCHVAEDYSEAAVAGWHHWLAKHFGTIDALNEAWGTDVWSERYQRFDQVPAPRPTPFMHHAGLTTAYRRADRERIAEFAEAQMEVLREHSAAPVTHNFGLGFAVDFERMSTGLDFVSFDDYPSSKKWRAVVLDNDLFRNAKPGKAHWLMETSVAHNGWFGEHETVHPPGFLRAEAVASFALGAQTICYWLWRQQRAGCELPHSAVMSAWFKPSIGHASVGQVDAARQELRTYLTSTRPATAQIGLTWSDHARVMLQTEPIGASSGRHTTAYRATIDAWHGRMIDAGFHRDVRFEGAAIDDLKVLVTPAMPYVSDAFLAKVEQWVRAGGTWICGPLTGMRTAEHGISTVAALGAVEALAGVEVVFGWPVTESGATVTAWGETAELAGWCHAMKPTKPETKVLGVLEAAESAHAGPLAVITARPVGEGRVVMLTAEPQGEAGERILTSLLNHYASLAGVVAAGSPTVGTIVVPRVSDLGETTWIAVNLDGRGGIVRDSDSVMAVEPYGSRLF